MYLKFFRTCSVVILTTCLSISATAAFSKPLKNSILKNTKVESLSHKGRHGFQKTKSITRRGTAAQRFEIRHGNCGKSSGWNDCETDRGRIERKEKPKNRMSKPGQGVWYGYSIFIPKNFTSLGRANTILSQAKVEKNSTPLWALTFNDNPYLLYSDGKHCKLGSLNGWRGKWNDIVVYADYAQSGKSVYFQLFKNDKLICTRKSPIMPKHIPLRAQKIGIKYGIYSSFVSRYLDAKKTKNVDLTAYKQNHSSGKSKSPTGTPFKNDWGVKLPTHVIYYDEMRFGSRRDQVDVRMLEKAGVPPVD